VKDEVRRLRGEGRWEEALGLVEDPLARADLLSEQALFTGSAEARAAAARELDRAEAQLALGRGRVLHARFLAEREEDPDELALFERALGAAERADDPLLAGWCRFWIGLVHQVVRGEHELARPHLEAAHTAAGEAGDPVLGSYAVRHLGFCHDAAGDAQAAWDAFADSVRLRRAEGFLPGVAAGLLTLGEVALEQGRPEQARPLLAEARELAERTGSAAFLRRIEAVEGRLP
jgi:tetratricopeptide (TPR) repeat protein